MPYGGVVVPYSGFVRRFDIASVSSPAGPFWDRPSGYAPAHGCADGAGPMDRAAGMGLVLAAVACLAAVIGLAFVNRDRSTPRTTPASSRSSYPWDSPSWVDSWPRVCRRIPWAGSSWPSLSYAIPGPTNQYTRYALVTNPGVPFTPWIPWIGDFGARSYTRRAWLRGIPAHAERPVPVARLAVGCLGGRGDDRNRGARDHDRTPTAGAACPNPTYVPVVGELGVGPLGYVVFFGRPGRAGRGRRIGLIRLRRATGEERLQLRWIADAAAFAHRVNVVVSVSPGLVRGAG